MRIRRQATCNMKNPLRIVILADTPESFGQIDRQLRRSGVSFCSRLIASRESLIDELKCHRPDAILSNFQLPSFEGQAALSIATAKRPDVPFIFVIGSEEETAASQVVERHRRGNVLKTSVAQLAGNVRQAVRQARQQTKLRDAALQALTAQWMAQ